MKTSSAQKNRYFYEYAFARTIAEHNEANPKRPIRTSEGRFLRKKLADYLTEKQVTMANCKVSTFEDGLKNVFGDYSISDLSTSDYMKEYIELTGFSNKSAADYGGTDKYIPISPYDPRFSKRESVMKNGSSILFVDMNEVESLDALPHFSMGENKMLYKNVEGNILKILPEQALTSDVDYSPIWMLAPYMSKDEYDAVSPWILSGRKKKPENLTLEEETAFFESQKKDMVKSATILRGLKEMGIPYTIEKDYAPGQIQAKLTGTKIRVRITEREGTEHYIGRVYDTGAQIYYSTTKKENNQIVRYGNPTARECLNLVRFALNKPVENINTNSTYELNVRGRKVSNHSAVHSKSSYVATAGDYDVNGNKVVIRSDLSSRSVSEIYFHSPERAEKYLQDSISSARENFIKSCDLDRLIRLSKSHAGEPDYVPNFSGDIKIAAYQQAYWSVLTGKEENLLRPGKSADDYEEFLGDVGEYSTNNIVDKVLYDRTREELLYEGSPEEMCRQHLADNVDYLIGNYEKSTDGKRFNPVGVAAYQTSEYGIHRNNNNIVGALRRLGIDASELKGSDFYNNNIRNRLIQFDGGTMTPMKELNDPFIQKMYGVLTESLVQSGVSIDEKNPIMIDENGIVRYQGSIAVKQKVGEGSVASITGTIGQIFTPNERGMIETKYHGSENYYIVPGYEAYVLPQKFGEKKSVMERTRLKGYEQNMVDTIRYQVRQNVLDRHSVGEGEYVTESPIAFNNVYHHLYDERHSLDFMDQYKEQGMSEDLIWGIIDTEARRVRYGNVFREEATVNAQYRAENFGDDLSNDNFGDVFHLVDGKNMAILSEEEDGYFDPVATSTGINQGITRYLVSGAKVSLDGSIVPSEKEGDRTPILSLDVTKDMAFNPFDRQQMGFGVLMTASAVAEKANVAQMTFGGWNQDDGIVISKAFAEKYGMRNHEGVMRNIIVGDKLSCLNGNKGVVPIIIDPDMPLEEAREQGIEEQVKWFKANPELEVVMSPFSAASRFNGGMTRELMKNPKNLVRPDGAILEGAMGELSIVITDKSAESKTHIYDEEEVAKGKGRKVSSQLAWSLQSQNCSHIMRECYGGNTGAIENLREYLIVSGLDISEIGELRMGYHPHEGEERKVLEMPKLLYNKKGDLDLRLMRQQFANSLSLSGGVMEFPFPLTYATGEDTPPMNPKKTDVIYKAEEWTRAGYTRKDGVYVRPTTVHRKAASGERVLQSETTYGVPVLSAYLRSGQEFEDGSLSVHDYTSYYIQMFEQGVRYRDYAEKLKETPDDANLLKMQEDCMGKAQAAFDGIAGDVSRRKFMGKHNMFRDEIMSHRMNNSVTAIWSADPRLDIDQIGVSKSIADGLGLKDGDHMLYWRDPALRDGCLRYGRVAIKEDITGFSIAPCNTKSMDGDFDGDSVGGLVLLTEAAKKEAMDKLSVKANLLDYGSKNEKGLYNLYLHDSLDIKVAMHYDPALKERWDKITEEVNSFEEAYKEKKIGWKALNEKRDAAVSDLNAFYKDAYKDGCGQAYIRYDGLQNHLESIHHACIETGAKGSMSKLGDYLKYYGATCELNADGTNFNYDTLKEFDSTLSTRQDLKDVQYATAVKSFCTGMAGAVSQRGVKALREHCQKAVLEMTYPVTQSVLQVKHNPEDAKQKQGLLMNSVKKAWNGNLMESTLGDDGLYRWNTVKGDDKKPVKATKEEWIDNFYDFYTSSSGLNVAVNKSYIEEIATAMTDEEGFVVGIDAMTEKAPILDRLAYGGDFETLKEAAKAGENFFDGYYQRQFMPSSLRKNLKSYESEMAGFTDDHSYQAVTKKDVLSKTEPKPKMEKIAVSQKKRMPEAPVSSSNPDDGCNFA